MLPADPAVAVSETVGSHCRIEISTSRPYTKRLPDLVIDRNPLIRFNGDCQAIRNRLIKSSALFPAIYPKSEKSAVHEVDGFLTFKARVQQRTAQNGLIRRLSGNPIHSESTKQVFRCNLEFRSTVSLMPSVDWRKPSQRDRQGARFLNAFETRLGGKGIW